MGLDFFKLDNPSLLYLLGGIWVTLQYAGLSICLGFIGGTFLAIAKISTFLPFRILAQVYVSLFRGTPLLVQLFLIYFGLPHLLPIQITPFEAGIAAFSLNSAAYVCEIIRSGIQSIDKGQMEAALSLGISRSVAMRQIILPQAVKNILPALVNEMVNLLKESAIVSVIGEADLLRRAQNITAEKYIYFEPYLAVALIYYVLVMILTLFAKLLEDRLKRSD